MKKHVEIRVQGLVQGVWFRKTTKQKAVELNLCGFVQNELDGGVFIVAEGRPDQLEEFISWCHRGPERAVVDSVSITEKEWVGHQAFVIQY